MRFIYPSGIVVLSALLLAFLISDAWQDSRQRHQTDEVLKVAKEWKTTAEKWEQTAKGWERVANRCVEELESERR